MTLPEIAVDLAPNNPRELRLANPVMAASGCFGYGQEYAHLIDVQRLGAFVSKGITPKGSSRNTPRSGSTGRFRRSSISQRKRLMILR